MRLKENVELGGLHVQLHMALTVAEKVWKSFGYELTVTSTTEGDHGTHSLHYAGYAVDLRTRDVAQELVDQIASKLQSDLRSIDSRYDVVVEPTHIHVELDILKRKTQ